jgi:hypothetical protein
VVDLDAAFGQQLLDIAVRQREAQVPAHASTITSGGKQKPANAEHAMGVGRILMATVCLLDARSQQLQQSPRPRPVPILLGLIHMLPSSPTGGSPSTL